MKPSLIICIGGSGMKIGHAMKSKFNKFMPEALLANDGSTGYMKFCFIENDINEIYRAKNDYRDVYDENEIIRIGNINANKIVTEIKKKKEKNLTLTDIEEDINFWRDEKVYFADIITNIGLAANRQLGRIAIAEGYDLIYSKLEEFKRRLLNPTNTDSRNSLTVYIITGICGGTGSSMFFDVSAMVDQLMGADALPNKIAFLLNTKYFLEQKIESGNYTTESQEYKNLQINSWAFINECEFFMKKCFTDQSMMGNYTARKSRHTTRVSEGRPYVPFTNAFLFDINCSNGGTLPLGNFYRTMADMIFYALTSASMDKIDSEFFTNKFFDSQARQNYVDYNTIAYKTIKFPSEEFRLYFEYRYLYEIFKNGFLRRENIDNKKIKEKAIDFVNQMFKNNDTSVFREPITDLKSKYSQDNETINSYTTSMDQYLLSGDKLISKQDFSELFSTHQVSINSINRKIGEELNKIEPFGFDRLYNTRGNVADTLRKALWDYSHEVILEHGYYGLLGLNEGNITINGFINEVYEILKNSYSEITQFKNKFDESQLMADIEDTRVSVLAKLNKGLGRKKLKDIQAELNSYHQAIDHYFDRIEEYHFSRLKQDILYQFAIGDNKENLIGSFFGQPLRQTELKSFRHSLSVGFGTTRDSNDDTSCLIWAFRKEEGNKSNTIWNNYRMFLPDEWEKTKNDLFTIHIPNNLSSFISTDTAERWKDNTIISDLFSKYVKTGPEGLKLIFGEDINHQDYLLPRLGEERESINEDIKIIIKRIREKFEELYTNNTDSEIYKFLNRSIQEAYTTSTENIQEQIKTHVTNLLFPLRDVSHTRNVVPGVNVHSSLGDFVTDTFSIDRNRVVPYQKMPLNQMVLIGIATDFQYERISENTSSKIVFENRNTNKFRPFLHNEWNNFVNGPYGAHETVTVNSAGGSSYNIMDAFLISHFFEILAAISPEAGNLLFVENDSTLTILNGKRAAPITMNPRSKNFSFFTVSEIVEENHNEKFYVISEARNPEINLGRLFDNLEFSIAFRSIQTNQEFPRCFSNFVSVISENKEAFSDLLTVNIKNDLVNKIVETQELLNNKLRRKQRSLTIPIEDVEFVENFSSKMISLCGDLLDININ